MAMIRSSGGRKRSFCRSSLGFVITALRAKSLRVANHTCRETGIPKRKKTAFQMPLSCDRRYFIQPEKNLKSAGWENFTGDELVTRYRLAAACEP
jgi:hypothetical protein